ncbi:terpene synthase family protein [Chitinophaga barathri]|uniref:Terpene synthase n=1 Tax=Chitinophaga barathri TaxID=1647451 RepID=A0A3N4M7S9_9BACT|nr:terpene synthase family protein [Chitinophaga barathri]RPD39305.1 hypothetical protein EG028_19455 [Chitinophaga barathri]
MEPIQIPALYCPTVPLISPFVNQTIPKISSWLRNYNLLPESEIIHYQQQGFVHMTSRFYPAISRARLEILSKFYTLLFISDDQLDHVENFRNAEFWREFAGEFMAVVAGQKKYTFQDGNPPLAALTDLWAEMRELSTSSWQAQFQTSLWQMYKAAFWENDNLASGKRISLHEYMTERQYLGAANIATDAIEFAYPYLNLSQEIKTNIQFIRATELCRNTVCWANDLFSLAKELEHGGAHNLVLLLKNSSELNFEEAIDEAVKIHNLDVLEMIMRSKELKATFPLNFEISKYLEALLQIMKGNIDWSINDTTRYYNFLYAGVSSGAKATYEVRAFS